MRAALSVVMSEAVENGLIATNPTLYKSGSRRRAGTLTKSERQQKVRPMSWSERERFLTHARETRLSALFELLVKTGMRPGEALALRIDDIDFGARTVRVEHSLETESRAIKSTKTYESRTVDLSPQLVQNLKAHVQRLRRHTFEKGRGEVQILFPSEANTYLDHANVARVYRRVLKSAELPAFRLYDLRHTYASYALSEGTPLTYVAAQLGHASPEITLRYYARWIPSEGQRFADVLDQKPAQSPNDSPNTGVSTNAARTARTRKS